MSDSLAARVARTFAETIDVHREFASRSSAAVGEAAAVIATAMHQGGKLLLCGNGGSASDAQHVAAELVGRFQRDRRALAAVALTVDTSVVTSIANDLSFDDVFARQIEAIGTPKDVLLAISTSGRSPNVIRAVDAAKRMSMKTVALTGADGGPLAGGVDVHVNVSTRSTARAQEVHRTILHVICEILEQELAGA
jgi:phosphoheptose isomerase